jgi:uncharacterized alpha-E superfamily protein
MTSLLMAENRSESLRAAEGILWTHLLRALSAQQMYTQTHSSSMNADGVLTFLIRDEAFPRSLFFSLKAIGRYIWPLPQSTTTLEHHQIIMSEIFTERLNELPAEMIHTRMDDLQAKLANLSSQISQQWFHPDRSVT